MTEKQQAGLTWAAAERLPGRVPGDSASQEPVPEGRAQAPSLKMCMRKTVAGGPRIPRGWLEAARKGPGRGQLPRRLGLATEQTPSPVRDWRQLGLPTLTAASADTLPRPSLSSSPVLSPPPTPGTSPPKALLVPAAGGSHGRPGWPALTWLFVACAQPPPSLINTNLQSNAGAAFLLMNFPGAHRF